jgi:heat shock protein HslJ
MKNLLALFLLLCLTACDGELKMSDLAGNWQLTSMNGELVPTDVRGGQGVTLEIQEDGKFAGQSPINRYFGQINTQDKSFKTGPVGMTMMAGPPELMDAERDFFTVINDVKTVDVKGGKLTLTGPDGKQLVFVRAK